ncbi:hypothetical protein BRD00_06135 [Halobacteriales archaeon QS_8_69_26]|nr:MAG: hypothetical protein BRD00_06135 [Halobacteriales archaeon QS_8_69_26]
MLDRDRAQSAVIAVVLLIGIVAVASIGILLVGLEANQESEERAENERIKQVFLQLDSDVDSVARSESDERTVDMDLPSETDAAVREESAGRIWINRTNYTTGNEEVLADQAIGAVRYSRDDGTTFAYQAGGVWMEEGENTRMVSAPAFSYDVDKNGDSPTLTVPIVTTDGDTRLNGGDVRVKKQDTIAPLNDVTVVENDLVTLRVKSRWYIGWAEYFRQLTNDDAVTVDRDNQTATMQLMVPAVAPTVDAGVIAGAANSELDMQQSDNSVDSYNSSDKPYASHTASERDNGKVVVAGDVDMRQDAEIRGDLEVGGDVNFQSGSSAKVTGNLSHDTSTTFSSNDPKDGPPHVDGWVADNASVQSRTPVDGYIDLNVGRIRDNNNNASYSGILDDIESGSDDCDPCVLPTGSYYLTQIQLDDDDVLILDTTGGPIDLAVNRTIDIQGDDSRVQIVGNSRVNVFVNGLSAGSDPEFRLASGAKWRVDGDRAPQSWVYLNEDADAKLKQEAWFTGVLYGPGRPGDGGAGIDMNQDARVFGAILGDIDPLQQNTSIHYDRALRQAVPVTTNVAIPRLTFLHVAVHEVEVEDE